LPCRNPRPRASCAACPIPFDRFPLLAALSLPESALPPGCVIPLRPRFPLEGAENRRVTTDPRAFVLVDEELTRPFRAHLRAAYYSVYREKGELGVFGWAFDDDRPAADAHGRLAKKFPDFRWWHRGRYVVCLWRDRGTSDGCFRAFEVFVRRKVQETLEGPG
jgi:hypothetical protein